MSQARNSAYNLAFSIAQAALAIITVPLYLKYLGLNEYGVVAIFWLMLAAASTLDLGVAKTTNIEISKLDVNDKSNFNTELTKGLTAASIIGAIYTFLILAIGEKILEIFISNPAILSETKDSLSVISIAFPVVLLTNVMHSSFEGKKCFLKLNAIQTVNFTVFQISPILALIHVDGSLETALTAAIVSKLFGLVVLLFFSNRLLNFRPIRVSIRSIWDFGITGRWIAANSATTFILENIDKILVGLLKGSGSVPLYIIPFNLVSKIRMIPESISRAVFPEYAKVDENTQKCICNKYSLYIALGTTLPLIIFILFSKIFFQVWVPTLEVEELVDITHVFAVGLWINGIAYPSFALFEATGRSKTIFKIYRVTSIIYLILLWNLINLFGPIGGAVAWASRTVIDSIILIHLSQSFSRYKASILGLFLILCISIMVNYTDQSISVKLLLITAIIAFTKYTVMRVKSS